jgi:hypothetical protein
MNQEQSLRILSLMHSPDDWKTIGNKPTPYYYEIDGTNQSLCYFGANHSRDISDVQFMKLEEYWELFVTNNEGVDKVVLVESRLRKLWGDKETAVINDSEAGYITLLASKENVSILCPEPDRKMERDYLLQKYSKDQIQYYYFARIIHVWHRIPEPRESFEDFIKDKLYHLSNDDWAGYDFSLEHMKVIHKNIFSRDFDENDIDFIKSIVNPMTDKSIINNVARDCSVYRNIHIVYKIIELWNENKSIFVVFGLSHAVLQEPALKHLLK